MLFNGMAWRDVPEHYGSWPTVYWRFLTWRRKGVWALMVLLDATGSLARAVEAGARKGEPPLTRGLDHRSASLSARPRRS